MGVKENIVDAAYRLFAEDGLNKVSVGAICKESGCSKGGFYHHFESKEALVEFIVVGYVKELKEELETMVEEKELDVILGISRVIDKVNSYKTSQMNEWPGIQKMLSFEGNHIIIQSMVDAFNALMNETYTKLIERGNHEGILNVQYPKPLAALLTREVAHLYGQISMVLMSEDKSNYDAFKETVRFSENFLNGQLGLTDRKLGIDEKVFTYVDYAMKNMP